MHYFFTVSNYCNFILLTNTDHTTKCHTNFLSAHVGMFAKCVAFHFLFIVQQIINDDNMIIRRSSLLFRQTFRHMLALLYRFAQSWLHPLDQMYLWVAFTISFLSLTLGVVQCNVFFITLINGTLVINRETNDNDCVFTTTHHLMYLNVILEAVLAQL